MTKEYNFEEIRKILKGYNVFVRANEEFLKIVDNFLKNIGKQNPFKVGDIIRFGQKLKTN